MKQSEATKIINDLDLHYIDFCPNCGDKMTSEMIEVKELRKVLLKIKSADFNGKVNNGR